MVLNRVPNRERGLGGVLCFTGSLLRPLPSAVGGLQGTLCPARLLLFFNVLFFRRVSFLFSVLLLFVGWRDSVFLFCMSCLSYSSWLQSALFSEQ